MKIYKYIAIALAFISAQNISAQQTRENHEIEFGVPLYYDTLIKRLDFPLAWGKSEITDYNKWNETARAKLIECFLALPPDAPFDYEIVEREQRDGYQAQKIMFNISGYSRVPAYLLVPDNATPANKLPALVMLHDHGAEFFIGKEKMVKPFGVSNEVTEKAQKWVDQLYSGKYVGDEYARNGYVVLSVDALFWGERGRKEGVSYEGQQALSANLLQLGMTWAGVITNDDMRSVDFLASLPFVDSAKIGAVGLSMGAHRAWMLSAAKKSVAATVAICWISTTDVLMRPVESQLKGGSAYSMLVPNLRNYLDFPHVASITCPRPLLFISGQQDKLFPVSAVESAYGTMRKVWESQGASDNLVTEIYEAGHIFNSEMQETAIKFLDKHLK